MKNFIRSKTVWTNALVLVYALVGAHTALPAVDPTALAIATTIANLVLRFTTTTAITVAG